MYIKSLILFSIACTCSYGVVILTQRTSLVKEEGGNSSLVRYKYQSRNQMTLPSFRNKERCLFCQKSGICSVLLEVRRSIISKYDPISLSTSPKCKCELSTLRNFILLGAFPGLKLSSSKFKIMESVEGMLYF